MRIKVLADHTVVGGGVGGISAKVRPESTLAMAQLPSPSQLYLLTSLLGLDPFSLCLMHYHISE